MCLLAPCMPFSLWVWFRNLSTTPSSKSANRRILFPHWVVSTVSKKQCALHHVWPLGKGGVVVIGKSAPVTFVDKLGRHLPWASFVGGFQLVLNITLVTPLRSKIVWTINWPAIARPNAHDYTKKCFGNWICNNFWSDSTAKCAFGA